MVKAPDLAHIFDEHPSVGPTGLPPAIFIRVRPLPKASHPATAGSGYCFAPLVKAGFHRCAKNSPAAIAARLCGSYWIRTSDLFHVKEAL